MTDRIYPGTQHSALSAAVADNTQLKTQNSKPSTLMAVFAHPDDETFGCAGTMAKYAAQGTRVIIVSATRGEVGEISNLSNATPETLGQAREGELRCAGAAVGAADVIFLDYIDGQVANADFGELVGKVALAIRQYQPDVILTFGPEGAYGHPDHVTIHKAATQAWSAAANPENYPDQLSASIAPHRANRLYYAAISRTGWRDGMTRMVAMGLPRVGFLSENAEQFRPGGNAAPEGAEFGVPDEQITTAIDISAYAQQKYTAIQCHASQLAADFPLRYITVDMIAQVLRYETYSRVNPDGGITLTSGPDQWSSEL